MKPKRKLFFTPSSLILFFMFLSSVLYAQPDGIDPAGDPDLPIDGGLGILIAAGVGYGLKKMRDHNKANKKIKP